MPVIVQLGGPRATRRSEDLLRGGEVAVRSPRGVALATRLLIEALPKSPPAAGGRTRALFGMDTEGAAALAAAGVWPGADVRWFHLDAYVAAKVRRVFEDNGRAALPCEASAELPETEGGHDVVALAFPKGTEALLVRDLVEAAHDALRAGGKLVAAAEGDGDGLRKAVAEAFGAATPGPPARGDSRRRGGAVFFGTRKRERAQRRDRSHVLTPEIASAAGGPPLRVAIETRPGTFAHGSFDRGTRALLEWYLPGGDRNVLDLGAGCGAIGICAALRAPEARVVLVESNVRAAECARRNLARNGVAERCDVLVRADLEDIPLPVRDGVRGFDRCLANPPYFGDLRIARSFCENARAALREGGGIALVVRRGKASDAHEGVLGEVFRNCTTFDAGDYAILTATR